MPEGDTIARAAFNLSRALNGHRIVKGWVKHKARQHVELKQPVVEKVESRGKNLLIHFDDGQVLHTHMMMTGSWHLYRPGQAWRQNPGAARVVLETEAWVAVCFAAPVVELGRNPAVLDEKLGPDLLAETFDLDGIINRLRSVPKMPFGVAVMTQHLMAGVGNVYKSEACYIERINPFLSVSEVPVESQRAFVQTARKLLQLNLTTRHRVTRTAPGSDAWVYDRSGRPCFTCGTAIKMQRQGSQARSTYFCFVCQNVPAER